MTGGQEAFSFSVQTNMDGNEVGFNLSYDSKAQIVQKTEITIRNQDIIDDYYNVDDKYDDHVSKPFKQSFIQISDDSESDFESLKEQEVPEHSFDQLPLSKQKVMTYAPNDEINDILNDTIEVAYGMILRKAASNLVLSKYIHLAYLSPIFFFLDTSLLIREFSKNDNNINEDVSTIHIKFNYRKKFGPILQKRHIIMKISCNLKLLQQFFSLKNPLIESQMLKYEPFWRQMIKNGKFIPGSNKKFTKQDIIEFHDFGAKICETKKEDLRLLNTKSFVPAYLTYSFLDLACSMFGSTKDKMNHQQAGLLKQALTSIRNNFGLTPNVCEMSSSYQQKDFQLCAKSGKPCKCDGSIAYGIKEEKYTFNPCLQENSKQCIQGEAFFDCSEEIFKKYVPEFHNTMPKGKNINCYCSNYQEKKKLWIKEKEMVENHNFKQKSDENILKSSKLNDSSDIEDQLSQEKQTNKSKLPFLKQLEDYQELQQKSESKNKPQHHIKNDSKQNYVSQHSSDQQDDSSYQKKQKKLPQLDQLEDYQKLEQKTDLNGKPQHHKEQKSINNSKQFLNLQLQKHGDQGYKQKNKKKSNPIQEQNLLDYKSLINPNPRPYLKNKIR